MKWKENRYKKMKNRKDIWRVKKIEERWIERGNGFNGEDDRIQLKRRE